MLNFCKIYLLFICICLFSFESVIGAGKWIQYDDDNPTPQWEEDITRLSGGGNSFYLLTSATDCFAMHLDQFSGFSIMWKGEVRMLVCVHVHTCKFPPNGICMHVPN